MVRLPNGADSCSLCIYELRKVGGEKPRRLGSRGREGRIPGMAASEWGLGVGVREKRRADRRHNLIMKPTRKEGCAWARGRFCMRGERSHITGDRRK